MQAVKNKLLKCQQNLEKDGDAVDDSDDSTSSEEDEEEDEMDRMVNYITYLADGINQANANIKAQERMLKTFFNVNVHGELENRSEDLLKADEEAQRKRNTASERAFNTIKRVGKLEEELKQHDQFKSIMKSMFSIDTVKTDKKEMDKKNKSKTSKKSKSEQLKDKEQGEEYGEDTILAKGLANLEEKKKK